jgi:8-hydroxy-5-deazaflavin:NADPH oxidoreductase
MSIAVLGTGMVANAIATKLVHRGHQVMMGSRTANSDAGQEWLCSVRGKAQIGTFSDVAAFGEVVFDCTNGANSLAALRQAGATNLRGKVLIHVSNPLDFQRECRQHSPCAIPIRSANRSEIMVQPSLVAGNHNIFICGNDQAARGKVVDWLCEWFG